MFRGKIVLIILFFSLLPLGQSLAQTTSLTSSRNNKTTPSAVPKLGLGFGTLMWTERIFVEDNLGSARGLANYAGIFLNLDQSWTKGRAFYGFSLGAGFGKATATGFEGVSYPDSGQRDWTMGYIQGYRYYRLQWNVMLGFGAMVGIRKSDWKSRENAALRAEPEALNKVVYSPEFLLRWKISKRFEIFQAIAPMDFSGHTLWRWGINRSF